MRAIGGIILTSCLWAAGIATAQQALFDEADAHAQAGNFDAMQRAYDVILAASPQNVRALLGRATALAWKGSYAEAEQTYGEVLALEPENLEALTGLGYARAWAGDHAGALSAFATARAIDPSNLEARKGEAFVYLWSGEYVSAENAFSALARDYPLDGEILTALGQARLQQGFGRLAVDTFDRALAVDPTREAARMGRIAAFSAPPLFEFGGWFGSASNADSGLRQLDFAYWPNLDTRIAARYDDSLSLDNPALARRGESAETLLVGATYRLSDAWVVGGEVGVRSLPDGDQNLYRGEVVWVHPRTRVTLGAQVGAHDLGYDDTLTYLGLAVPLGPSWTVELNNYFSEIGENADEEQRSILNVEYRAPAGWSALVGAGGGSVEDTALGTDESVKVAHAVAFIPVFGYHRLVLTLRREEVAGESFNIAMVGFTYRLVRNN